MAENERKCNVKNEKENQETLTVKSKRTNARHATYWQLWQPLRTWQLWHTRSKHVNSGS